MKKLTLVILAAGLGFMLTACNDEETRLEKKIEQGEAVSKQMGDVSNIPRVVVAPDKRGGKDGSR